MVIVTDWLVVMFRLSEAVRVMVAVSSGMDFSVWQALAITNQIRTGMISSVLLKEDWFSVDLISW